jgi:hypothetical protein
MASSSGIPGGLTFLQTMEKLDSFFDGVAELAYAAAARTSSKRSRMIGDVRCEVRTSSRVHELAFHVLMNELL